MPHSSMLEADDYYAVALAARDAAVASYDPARGVRLGTYCWAAIRARCLNQLRIDMGRWGGPSGAKSRRICDAPIEALARTPASDGWDAVDDRLALEMAAADTSPKVREVVEMMLAGLTISEVARELHVCHAAITRRLDAVRERVAA